MAKAIEVRTATQGVPHHDACLRRVNMHRTGTSNRVTSAMSVFMSTSMPLPVRRAVAALLLATAAACAGRTGGSSLDASAGSRLSGGPIATREQTADQQVHHVLNRVAFGARPQDVALVRAIGVDQWIARQLEPERIPDASTIAFLAQFKTLGQTGEQLMIDYPPPGAALARLRAQGGTVSAADSMKLAEQGRQSYAFLGEIASSRVARAVMSERQLQEVMVDFWENHFNVFAGKDRTRYFLQEYDANTIRPNVLGKFRTLLGAVAQSPAMLYYLDNWQSVADSGQPTLGSARRVAQRPGAQARRGNTASSGALRAGRATAGMTMGDLLDRGLLPEAQQKRLRALPAERLAEVRALTPAQAQERLAQFAQAATNRRRGLNENYARELMELHTLGVDGGYTQHDVTEVARALTGWTIARGANGGDFTFRGESHDAGAKTILGVPFPAGRGQEEGEAVLDMLARSPRTATFIATKLARRFVSDTPPAALVERAAATFRRTDGDVRETLRTILTSPEFFATSAYRAKVKSPFELVTSTLRAMQAAPDATPRTAQFVSRLGQPIFGHQAPNGYPETGDSWMNTGSILNRINFGLAAASGRVPGVRLANWPATTQLAAVPREQQVDGVIQELFGGAVSSDTRQVLLTGTNPFLQARAATDTMRIDTDDDPAMVSAMDTRNRSDLDARAGKTRQRETRRTIEQQQKAAGREAIKPTRAATLTQAIGTLPPMVGFAQIVGLALGAPEFQRR